MPMPPMFAAKGIPSISALEKLEPFGSLVASGRMAATIRAVVAVFDIHIESAAVRPITPSNTTEGLFPRRLKTKLLNSTSRLYYENTLAMTNPPNMSMTTGLA